MLCLMKISLVTMYAQCAQQTSKLPRSVQQTGFALTWKKSPPVSVVNWAFASCKLCTEGLTAPDAMSSSAQRALPLTAKSQRPPLSKCHRLTPHTSPLEAVASSTDPGGGYEGQTVQATTTWWKQPDPVFRKGYVKHQNYQELDTDNPSEPLPTQNILWFCDIWLQPVNREWKQVFFVLKLECINSWKFSKGWVKAFLFSVS